MRGKRSWVASTLAVTTLLFFALLGGIALLQKQLPRRREAAALSALESGDTELARSRAGKVEDEELRLQILSGCDYRDALRYMEEGKLQEAAESFEAAGEYEDAEELALGCRVRIAEALRGEGLWEEAIGKYAELAALRDTAEEIAACRYAWAEQLLSAGDRAGAAALFRQAGDYQDSQTRFLALAVEITGYDDPEKAMAAISGKSPEDMARMSALQEKRETLPCGVLAVGFFHTVGLRSDGAVLACGDNSFGQCGVQGWHDVVAVAAGAYHTLALHRDGHVSAVGRNREGQCEVKSWENVTAIAAANYGSFALTKDGTVLCTKNFGYTPPASWNGLDSLCAGSFNCGALRRGEALLYPALPGEPLPGELVELCVATGCAVGLLPDGRLAGQGREFPEWSDLLTVSLSDSCLLGLKEDGSVLASFFHEDAAIDFSSVRDAVAIAAGGTHFAFLLRDGTVLCFGEDGRGQTETEGWVLAVAPAAS